MKCVFCGGELLNGKDKCDYCGKFQHEFVKEEEKKEDFEEIKNEKMNIGSIIISIMKITFIVAIIAIGAYFIINYLNNTNKFYGSWRCTTENATITNITFEKKIFKIKNSSSGYIEADYMIEKEVKEDDNLIYYLDVSASKRVANGQEYVDTDETNFEIVMNSDNYNELLLKNTNTGSEYKCYIDK